MTPLRTTHLENIVSLFAFHTHSLFAPFTIWPCVPSRLSPVHLVCLSSHSWPNPHLFTCHYICLPSLLHLMTTQRRRYPAHLSHYVSSGLRVYLLEQGVFKIDLQDYPHKQWVSLSSTIRPNDHRDHSSESFLLLEDGDLVVSTGDIEHTREIWDDTESCYLIRVKVTVSLLNRVRLPAPGISEGWITLFPEGQSTGGMITHVARGPSFVQPDSILQWFAGRHYGWDRIGRLPDYAPPGDRIPRTPSPSAAFPPTSTHRRKRPASEAGI